MDFYDITYSLQNCNLNNINYKDLLNSTLLNFFLTPKASYVQYLSQSTRLSMLITAKRACVNFVIVISPNELDDTPFL